MLRLAFGASAKGHIHALLILAVAVVSGSAVPARADDAPKNIQQSQDRLQELIGKCHNDVACLQQNASQIDGMPLLGLSLMLLKSDPNAALDWLVIAQLHCFQPGYGLGHKFWAAGKGRCMMEGYDKTEQIVCLRGQCFECGS